MNYMQTCTLCQKQFFGMHYCGEIHKPHDGGAHPVRPLTEADVRRIVREELGRAAASIGPTP